MKTNTCNKQITLIIPLIKYQTTLSRIQTHINLLYNSPKHSIDPIVTNPSSKPPSPFPRHSKYNVHVTIGQIERFRG